MYHRNGGKGGGVRNGGIRYYIANNGTAKKRHLIPQNNHNKHSEREYNKSNSIHTKMLYTNDDGTTTKPTKQADGTTTSGVPVHAQAKLDSGCAFPAARWVASSKLLAHPTIRVVTQT